jgi:hypothetical protein
VNPIDPDWSENAPDPGGAVNANLLVSELYVKVELPVIPTPEPP